MNKKRQVKIDKDRILIFPEDNSDDDDEIHK